VRGSSARFGSAHRDGKMVSASLDQFAAIASLDLFTFIALLDQFCIFSSLDLFTVIAWLIQFFFSALNELLLLRFHRTIVIFRDLFFF